MREDFLPCPSLEPDGCYESVLLYSNESGHQSLLSFLLPVGLEFSGFLWNEQLVIRMSIERGLLPGFAVFMFVYKQSSFSHGPSILRLLYELLKGG